MKKISFMFLALAASALSFTACEQKEEPGGDSYLVNVTFSEGGTASADPTSAAPGEKVTLTAVPDEGYALSEWIVESGDVILSSTSASPATFIMTAEEVNIRADFKQVGNNVLDAITDPVFKKYCTYRMKGVQADAEGNPHMPWDEDSDGVLSSMEASKVDWIGLSESENVTNIIGGDKIQSLSGIEYFTGLEYLNCEKHYIGSLDLTKNTGLTYLNINENLVEGVLDLSECTELTELYADLNFFDGVDISTCTKLKVISLYDSHITEISVSHCPDLERIDIHYNDITELDVSQNRSLKFFDADNCALASVDLTNNPELTSIAVYNNGLTDDTFKLGSHPNLTFLGCGNNQLTRLDVSGFPKLTNLQAGDNHITEITGLENCHELSALFVNCNELHELVLPEPSDNQEKLKYIHAYGNHLDELDCSKCGLIYIESGGQGNWYPYNDLWVGYQRKDGVSVEESDPGMGYVNANNKPELHKQMTLKIRCDMQAFWDSNLFVGRNARNSYITIEHVDCSCGMTPEEINRNNHPTVDEATTE